MLMIDDLILLSSSVCKLQEMLNICYYVGSQCRINAKARGNYLPNPPYARQRPITASHSSRYDMVAIIWSRYQYGPFLFFVAEVMPNYLMG